MKAFTDLDSHEVCMWLVAIGLGAQQEAFQANEVDGKLLVSLSEDDLKTDLELSGLQAKKVLSAIEEYQQMTSGGGGDVGGLTTEIEQLKLENQKLKEELEHLKHPEPAKPKAAPAQAPAPHGAPVLRDGARGAVAGVVLGAVGGAIAGDAKKGAKVGAAVGGTAGGLHGLRGRRHR